MDQALPARPAGHAPEPGVHMISPPHGGRFDVEITPGRADSGHPPLVLVPGIGGPRGTYHHQVRAFSGDRDVIALNLNPVSAPAHDAVDSGALDVLHVLRRFGVGPVDLLGASFGSCVCARIAVREPARVRRQVWVAPPVVHHPEWVGTFGPGWLLGGAAMKWAPARYRGALTGFLARHRVYSAEPDLSREELELLASRVTDTDLAPFFRRLAGVADWDWRRLPWPAPRPVLVVQGQSEHLRTPPDVLRAFDRLAGQAVAVVPGHHMPYLSYPQEFNRVVRGFLDGPGPGLALQ